MRTDPGLRRAKRVRPGLGSPDGLSEWLLRASPRPHNGWRHRASALRRLPKGGIFHPLVRAGEIVSGGTLLAEIVSPMTGEVMEEISAPVGGVVFFTCNKPMVTEQALLFRIVPRGLANA